MCLTDLDVPFTFTCYYDNKVKKEFFFTTQLFKCTIKGKKKKHVLLSKSGFARANLKVICGNLW